MIYLKIFWICMIILFVLYYIAKIIKSESMLQKVEDHGMLILIVAFSFLVVAIITRDPIKLLGIELPA